MLSTPPLPDTEAGARLQPGAANRAEFSRRAMLIVHGAETRKA
jgi:hypothetical protein